jgi:alpha-2-macroglobulin
VRSRVLAWVVPLSLLLSCASKPPRDLLVTSFTGRSGEDAAEPIRFRFNRGVVAADKVGVKLATPPVTIAPLVPIEARWEDPQTLVIVPTGELAPSTLYRVTLEGDLGARTTTPSYSFVHLPVLEKGVSGADLERVPPKGELVIGFNQPVRAADLAKQCKLTPGELTVAPTDPSKVAAQHAVRFSAPLEQGTAYQLVCEKLVGAGGTAPAEENVTIGFKTYPAFTVASFLPGGDDVPSDQVALKITFSNPVELADVAKALTAKPAIKGLAKGWLDDTRTRYTVEVDLDAEQNYQIAVGKLADVYGQPLENAEAHEFHTGAARPRLSLETGIFAVERGGKGYPIWTRNLSTLKVDCARIPADKLVALLTSEMDYDPWYDASTNKAIEWSKLGLNGKSTTLKPASKKNNWQLTSVPLHTTCAGGVANDERGVFLAEVGSPELKLDEEYSWRYRPRQRVLANVTDLGVLLKVGPASGLVWVTSLKSGKPVPGATVSIWDLKGKKAHTATSDASGLVRLPGADKLLRSGKPEETDPEDEWSSWRSQRVIATVEKDGDLAVVDGNWQNGIQIWNFGVKEDRSGGAARVRGFIQSDRGLYRPGETVSFKGLAREIVIGEPPRQPKDREIAIEVTDPRGSTVLETRVTLTKFGGFSFELPLSSEAALGDWWVTAKIGAQSFREKFLVEEFRKVEYEIKVTGNAGRHVARGSKLAWAVQADYLFGAPVAKAKVRWTVERRRHVLRMPKFPEYSFTDISEQGYDWWWSYEEPQLSFLGDGEGETDAKGGFSFAFEDPEAKLDGPQDYLATAEVKDETDQSVSKQVVVTAHPSEFYFGMQTQEWVQAVGMPFAINAIAVTPDGRQVAAKGKLSMIRRREDCTYSGGYRAEVSCTSNSETIWTRDVTIPATGTITERIMPKSPGEFVIKLEGTDAKGNPVAVSSWVWVLGKGEAFWSGDESDRMSIIASKQAYEPGETARLVPRTNLAGGSSLVSVERNGVIDAFVVETSSSGEGINLKLTQAHAPNVYVSVAAVRGRTGDGDKHRPRFQMGLTELDVSAAAQRLAVSVKTDKPSYEPGDQVTGVIKVVGKDGKPVSAEVSLSVADEGVLQLIAYKTPDPMAAFYAPWGLGIDAATNWNRISRLNDPREMDPDEGGDGGDGEGGSKIRSKFVNSAYWAPALVTDGNGEIRFKFTAPDNLTAFRLMAVAADMGSRFGSAENRVTTKKPLLLKPVLPRFLAEGDRAQVGVIVHNYTGAAGTAKVTAKASGVVLSGSKTVDVAKDGTARVMFDLDVGKLGAGVRTATFEFASTLGDADDAMRLEVPLVRPLAVDNVLLGSGKVEGAVSLPLAWDDRVLPADSTLALSVDRTGLGELEGGLKYLIEYPYGCLEQTMSRFIPLVKVKDLAASLDLKDLPGGKIDRYIAAGVARVYKFQHDDGQFSLWQGGEPEPHLTVYALFGLGEAKKAGVEVDPTAMKRGLEQVKRWTIGPARKLTGYEGGTMAMAAYVLAENGMADSGLASKLYAGYRGLPIYGQAFLLLAMEKGKSPDKWRKQLATELGGLVRGEGLVDETEDADSYRAMSSDVRSSAIVMMALLATDPANPAIERLAAGLKKAQGKRGYWRNTQENLYALVALAELARKDADGTTKITATVGGKKILAETLRGGRVVTVKIPLSQVAGGALAIETQGVARFSARLSLARRIDDAVATSEGITVTREYLDPDKDEVKKAIKTGDLVKVVVTVKPGAERRYLAVVDPIPAGFELVNSKLVTSVGRARDDLSDEQKGWWSDDVWTNIELRDDRVQAFADWMPARGEYKLVYLARATLPGKFTAPPTRAEAMYEPEIFARGKAAKVEVKR